MRCRRKPLEHEYFPVEKILCGNSSEFPEWVMEGFGTKEQLWIPPIGPRRLAVKTQEGTLVAPDDGYIIQGVEGEIWPIGASQFAKTYDVVEEV